MHSTRFHARRSLQRLRPLLLAALVGVLSLAVSAPSADAGCGCDKPPPKAAAVRPNVTYTGMPVTLFGNVFTPGQSYTVTFTSGIDGSRASVTGTAVTKRDLADKVRRAQLVVSLPRLPLGPAAISVMGSTAGGVLLSIADSGFTVAPDPVALNQAEGLNEERAGFRAAVGRDGTVYTSIDIAGVTEPVVLDVQMMGLPLRFTRNDVVFFNAQGFVMQKLVSSTNQPIPGMDIKPAKNPAADSDVLHYSRHEFATYFLQHAERLAHALDPTDPQWHLDGTPHIDHDHLIVAITGRKNDGQTLPPGPTTASTFESVGNSLFSMGLTGKSAVTIRERAVVDSYTRGTTTYGSSGDVFTNGLLTVKKATVKGSVAAGSHSIKNATITGTQTLVTSPISFMEADIPSGLPSLGTITLGGGYKKITGPGSFLVSSISLTNSSQLYIDNSAGPVTLYVTGPVKVSDWSIVSVADANPEKFAVYVPGDEPVTINADAYFSGVIYAPNSTLRLSGVGGYFGAFVGDTVIVNDGSKIHYDNALLDVAAPATPTQPNDDDDDDDDDDDEDDD